MRNTDLTKFDFREEGLIPLYMEGGLVEVKDELAQPYTAPLTYVTLGNAEYTYVLDHVFVAKVVSDHEGSYMVSGRDQALALIAKMFKKGTVDLTKWKPMNDVLESFWSAEQV